MATTIIVCDTCRWEPDQRRRDSDGKTGGAVLAEFVEAAAASKDVAVRRHSCLNGCSRHCNAAVVAEGKTAYYLTQLPPSATSAADVVEFAVTHSESEDGVVPKPKRPAGLDGHVAGRIPWIAEAQ